MTNLCVHRVDAVLRGSAVGSGHPVVLLHAGGESREIWRPVQAILADHGLRAVAFDLRGHGASTGEATTLETLAQDVGAVLEELPRPVALVGASLGGLAAAAALTAPEVRARVTVLVLVDVVPDPQPDEVRPWLNERGMLAPQRDLIEDVLTRGPALLASLGDLQVPIVLVRGGSGSPISDADVARLQQVVPDLSIELVLLAGHLVARDAPRELAHLLIDITARSFRASGSVADRRSAC